VPDAASDDLVAYAGDAGWIPPWRPQRDREAVDRNGVALRPGHIDRVQLDEPHPRQLRLGSGPLQQRAQAAPDALGPVWLGGDRLLQSLKEPAERRVARRQQAVLLAHEVLVEGGV